MGKYIYESHMGGLYTREEPVPFDDLYCEQCGDCDMELGYCETRVEAKACVEAQDIYTDKYIKEFLDEDFPEEGDTNGPT